MSEQFCKRCGYIEESHFGTGRASADVAVCDRFTPADSQPASDLVEAASEFISGKSFRFDNISIEQWCNFMADFADLHASQQNADLSRKVRKLEAERDELKRQIAEMEAEREHLLDHVSVISFDGYFEGEIAHVLDAWKAERECYSKNKYGGDEVEQRKAEFGSFDEAWDWILSHGDRCSKGAISNDHSRVRS